MTSADSLGLLGRVTGGLVVVIVVIGLVARIARRTGGQNGASGLRVVERVGLSREANLTVVEVSNRTLLLGVTAQGVTMLAHLDGATTEPGSSPAAAGPASDHPDLRTTPAHLPGLLAVARRRAWWPGRRGRRPGAPAPTPAPPTAATTAAQAIPAQTIQAQKIEGQRVEGQKAGVSAAASRPAEALATRAEEGTDENDFAPLSLPRLERRPMPARIALDEYPELATALRAAGRTERSMGTVTSTRPESTVAARAAAAYPDARRATPRTTTGPTTSGTPTAGTPTAGTPTAGTSTTAPRTRAEARAMRDAVARIDAIADERVDGFEPSGGRGPNGPDNGPGSAPDGFEAAIDAATNAVQTNAVQTDARAGRRAHPAAADLQASGSVLSPQTWRQGIDALRDLTVRRG